MHHTGCQPLFKSMFLLSKFLGHVLQQYRANNLKMPSATTNVISTELSFYTTLRLLYMYIPCSLVATFHDSNFAVYYLAVRVRTREPASLMKVAVYPAATTRQLGHLGLPYTMQNKAGVGLGMVGTCTGRHRRRRPGILFGVDNAKSSV